MGGGPFAIVEKEKFDYIKEMMRAKVPTFEVSMGESIFFRYCICFGFHVFIISSILLFLGLGLELGLGDLAQPIFGQ